MSLEKPQWNDRHDRILYDELLKVKDRELTEEEDRFCKMMYTYEEYASGLDGDE